MASRRRAAKARRLEEAGAGPAEAIGVLRFEDYSRAAEAKRPDPAGREVAPEHDWLSGGGFLDAARGCRPAWGQEAGWGAEGRRLAWTGKKPLSAGCARGR